MPVVSSGPLFAALLKDLRRASRAQWLSVEALEQRQRDRLRRPLHRITQQCSARPG